MSLADKLNYTIDAKLDIQGACIFQGVDLPDNAPFGDYGKYIRLLSGGGGFESEYEFTCIAEVDTLWCFFIAILLLKNGVRTFEVFLDGVSLGTLDGSSISSGINTYHVFPLPYADTITAGIHKVKVVSADDAKTAYVTEVVTDIPLNLYCQTTEGMTNIVWSKDEGANSFALSDDYKFFYYAGNLISTIYYGGNSWIGLNANSENIRYNRRDTYVETFYHQFIDFGVLKCIKFRWQGWSPYNQRTDKYHYSWEVFLFSNGDAMIVWDTTGVNTTFNGTFEFLGTAYKAPISVNPYVSFYRQDEAGSSWVVDYNFYSPAKSKHIFQS